LDWLTKELDSKWAEILKDELEEDYFFDIASYLYEHRKTKSIYPEPQNIFRAFNLCSFEDISVVILGQDPYHQKKEATGLCFSVDKTTKIPPSLKNIFKEIESDLGYMPTNPDLTRWAESGVLLLNSTLSVEDSAPNSHKNIGWQEFTDSIITKISTLKKDTIFILWGEFAKKKRGLISRDNHILEAVHPSPLSAHRGFFGCKHFSKTNQILKRLNRRKIDW
jgi:uracil-DNA glycosylase